MSEQYETAMALSLLILMWWLQFWHDKALKQRVQDIKKVSFSRPHLSTYCSFTTYYCQWFNSNNENVFHLH